VKTPMAAKIRKGRARFLIEILRAIKEVVGDSFPVGVRINGGRIRAGEWYNF